MKTDQDIIDTLRETAAALAYVASSLPAGDQKNICDSQVKTALSLCDTVTHRKCPPDVVRLVLAARVVAFESQDMESLEELDSASEAFADCVPWEDEDSKIASEIAHMKG